MSLLDKFTGASAQIVRDARGLKQQHEELRAAIAAHERQRDADRSARPPDSEFHAAAEAVVDASAEAWARDDGRALLLGLLGEDTTGVRTTPAGPHVPWALEDGMPWGARCFLFRAETKRALREGISALLATNILGAPGRPRQARAAHLQALERELDVLKRSEEDTVDALRAIGFAVEHRPDVIQRRESERRAAEVAAREEEERRRIDEARQAGHLGTPQVHQAGSRAVPSPYVRNGR